ncbi:MAG: glutamate--tRNA ligase, partial [Gammaproteobacteria bacterium]
MNQPVRTRFAPSPTGDLHIGGVRTALFSWLYARKHGGQFLLRIEDTDRERSTDEAIQVILDGMDWLELKSDEPISYQTQRFDRYREVIQQLLDTGHAYRCTCTKERLEKLRESQMQAKQKPRYDHHCRDKAIPADCGEPFVIRFRTPLEGSVIVDDRVRGRVRFDNCELDDLIIARTDGTPTYNLTVVVDDTDMDITHVIRGDDHLNNTPRQINIMLALGKTPPVYAHVPMILGEDGKKLSKRHGATNILEYREQGYLPAAVRNYLARLGWSHGDQEIFSTEEMIRLFDIDDINPSASALNLSKLQWLNQHYIKTTPAAELVQPLRRIMTRKGIATDTGPDLEKVIEAQQERAKTLAEMADNSRFFYTNITEYDEKAARKNLKPEAVEPLQAFMERLQKLEVW